MDENFQFGNSKYSAFILIKYNFFRLSDMTEGKSKIY